MADLKWLEEIEKKIESHKTMLGDFPLPRHLAEAEPFVKALRVAIGALESATIALADESPVDTVMRIAARARATLGEIERIGGDIRA